METQILHPRMSKYSFGTKSIVLGLERLINKTLFYNTEYFPILKKDNNVEDIMQVDMDTTVKTVIWPKQDF